MYVEDLDWLRNVGESHLKPSAISIWEKSILVELSDKEMVLVVVNVVGCLMATTLQFKLFSIFLWDNANL